MRFLRPMAALVVLFATGVARAAAPTPTVTPAAPTPAALESATAPPQAPPRPEARTVFAEISAGPGAELEAWGPETGRWSFVCRVPCDMAVPKDVEYRLTFPEDPPSQPFFLEAAPGRRDFVRMFSPSTEKTVGGIALIVLGSVTATVGLGVIFVGGFASAWGCSSGGACSAAEVEVAGVAALLGGGTLIVLGAVLLRNNHGKLAQTVSHLQLETPPIHLATAWLRAPAWRDSANPAGTGAPPVTFPLFSRSF
jgi:hypothetical protein